MNSQEKALTRRLFKLQIHESEGNTFEKLFTQIMNYADPEFEQIDPWGNIGDRKCDGRIQSKGIYYQVFAPKDSNKSYPDAIRKLRNDFNGLIKQWPEVREYYFVLNDKFRGVHADSALIIDKLIKENHLAKGRIFIAKDIEETVFRLEDDQILVITGCLLDLNQVTALDYSVVKEVVMKILKLPIISRSGEIKYPDWNEKILFNKLSPTTKSYLDFASQKLGSLNQYLSNESFLAEELQHQLTGLYDELKNNSQFNEDEFSGDYIFWEVVKKCSPRNESAFESAVITIMSKYFESCDIFEEPIKK